MNKRVMEEVSPTLLKGRITELKCELWFLEHGFPVSIPNIPFQYDMLVDIGDKIIKVQVKTCHEENDGDVLIFNLTSMTHNQQGYTVRLYNEKKVDYFMTEHNGQCYLVPFNECETKQKRLRLTPTKNGQVKGITFAKDYLAEKILNLEEVVE